MRLVHEARKEDPVLSLNAAVVRIGQRIGVNPDMLRGWTTQAQIDSGNRPGVTIGDAVRIKVLETEVNEFKHANAMADSTGRCNIALRYTNRLADVGAIASIGTVGDSFDNGLAESVVGLYKAACVKTDCRFRTTDQLELATLSWVHWFNEHRLHSSIGYLTPIEKENEYYCEINSPSQPASRDLSSVKPGAIHVDQEAPDRVGRVVDAAAKIQRHVFCVGWSAILVAVVYVLV